jgi:hypothetical protein
MSVSQWARTHREDLKLAFELIDAFTFIILTPVTAIGGYFMGASSLACALVTAIIALISSIRLWIKRSPLMRRLGVEHTSMDLPNVKE